MMGHTPDPQSTHPAVDAMQPLLGGRGGIGPAWTRGLIERPGGTADMGSWTAAVYTAEQQERLGVDEFGAAQVIGIGL